MTTRNLSDALKQVGQIAGPRYILCHAAYFWPETIPREWLKAASGISIPRQYEAALFYLRRRGLLELRPNSVTLSCPVASAVRNRIGPRMARVYAERVTATVIELLPWPRRSSRLDYSRLRPHAETCVDWIAELDLTAPSAAWMLGTVATLYHQEGQLADAALLMERNLAICEKALGRDSVDLSPVLSNLALIYSDQSRFAEAEALLQRALRLATQAPSTEAEEMRRIWAALERVRRQAPK